MNNIKTWRERLFEEQPQWREWPAEGGAVWEAGNSYKDDEIDDLREALECAEALLNTLRADIVDVECKYTRSCFPDEAQLLSTKKATETPDTQQWNLWQNLQAR